MAIADRLNKLRTDIEDTYQAINEIGGTIPSDKNTNNIPEAIRSVYNNLPKVSDTGTNVSLNPTLKGRLGIVPKGNTYQESTTGKNLFDKVSATNNQGRYVLNNDGTITNSNNWGNAGRTYLNPISLNANTYTLSYIPNLNGTTTQIRFSLVDGNTSTDITNNAITITNNIKQSYTFTLSDATNLKICIMPNGSSDGTLTLSDIQIEKGSTATSYEPYTGGQPAPSPDFPTDIQSATGTQKVVVSGKNLWNFELVQKGFNTVTGGLSNNSTRVSTEQYALLKSGSYTINSNKQVVVYVYDENKEYKQDESIITWQATPYTFTLTDLRNVRFGFRNSDNSVIVPADVEDIQLEKGNAATSYQPYQEPQEVDIELSSIELNKIGDYEDYIDGTPDNWVLYKNLATHTIKASDIETVSSYWLSSHGVYGAGILKTSLGLGYGSIDRSSFSSIAKKINAIANITENTYMFNGNSGYVFFFSSKFDTLEKAKEMLSGGVIVYNAETSTTTPITEEPLVSQLNELYYLQSYNDTTNVDVTGNLPMRITASAIKGA